VNCSNKIFPPLDGFRLQFPVFKTSRGWRSCRFPEALATLRKAFDSSLKTASITRVFASLGNRGAAGKILEELLAGSKTKYVSPYDIAVVYDGLNDKARTFEWLNKAYEEHSAFMVYMNSDPWLQPLRSEPLFQDLLRRMGLPNRRAYPPTLFS
jgi:hypothetical protein